MEKTMKIKCSHCNYKNPISMPHPDATGLLCQKCGKLVEITKQK